MMRNQVRLLPLIIIRRLLQCFLDGIVEEKIDEDGIEGGIRVLAKDLTPEELDAPDAAACGWREER